MAIDNNSDSLAHERTPFFENDNDASDHDPRHGLAEADSTPAEESHRRSSKPALLGAALLFVLLTSWASSRSHGSSPLRSASLGDDPGPSWAAALIDESASVSMNSEEDAETEYPSFDDFVLKYHKKYASAMEKDHRRGIYENNLRKIRNHNLQAGQGKFGWTMGVNNFADMLPSEIPTGFIKGMPHGPGAHATHHEFADVVAAQMLGNSGSRKLQKLPTEIDWLEEYFRGKELPAAVDWRAKNPPVVTPVKDQANCGSCWAVSSATVLETYSAIATGELRELSMQELVTCSENPDHCGGSGGCYGATAEIAMDYVANKGIVSEGDYPYTARDGECQTDLVTKPSIKRKVFVDGYSALPTNSYMALMHAVAFLGPVVVAVAADWFGYRGGVFDDRDYNHNMDIDHAVVLEGYGTDPETGEDFWLVRNSWGANWGEDGYIRLKREDPGHAFPKDLLNSINNNSEEMNALRDSEAWKPYCMLDKTPADGVDCTGPYGNETLPPDLVCGTSGLLYDGVVPVGARAVFPVLE